MGLRIGFAGFGFITVDLVAGGSSLPAGATAHLDFINGFYYAGGQEVALVDVLTGTPTIVAGEGADIGAGAVWPIAAATLLNDIAPLIEGGGSTIVVSFKSPDLSGSRQPFSVTGDTGAFFFGVYTDDAAADALKIYAGSDEVAAGNAVTAGQVQRIAATFVGGNRISLSLNGGTVATTSTATTCTALEQLDVGHAAEQASIGYLQSITFYPAVADAALPALSTL